MRKTRFYGEDVSYVYRKHEPEKVLATPSPESKNQTISTNTDMLIQYNNSYVTFEWCTIAYAISKLKYTDTLLRLPWIQDQTKRC